MVSYVLSPDAIASGNFTPGVGGTDGTLTPTYLPIDAFLSDLAATGVDVSNAQLIMTLPGSEEDFVNGVPAGTQVTFQIDVDGDGTPDYDLRPVSGENQSEIRVDDQISGNIGFFEGQYGIYPVGSDAAVITASGRYYLTTESGAFNLGEPMQIVPDPDGTVLNVDDLELICFTRGSLIDTPDGPRLIEALVVGDLVMTKDHGPQPIRWIGSRKVSASSLARHSRLRPIRIAAGALGSSVPEKDLVVSPQHRVLLSSRVVRNMFDADEVLVAAKKLLGFPGVTQDEPDGVEYFHILLDRHEVVRANGAWSETLLTGRMALRALGPEAVREIALLFPEIASPSYVAPPARRIAEGKRIPQMISRHLKNQRPLYEPVSRST